jgi:hypothetical protein
LYLPLRSDQYDSMAGLLPVFEMNLPEGALRERLRLQFAKSRGRNEREAKAIAHVLSGPPLVDSMVVALLVLMGGNAPATAAPNDEIKSKWAPRSGELASRQRITQS